jgi:hypothetical protein
MRLYRPVGYQELVLIASTNFLTIDLSESPENPVASARGCRGGEMLIPSATRHAALASGRWRMDEVANKFLASTKVIIMIFDIFM